MRIRYKMKILISIIIALILGAGFSTSVNSITNLSNQEDAHEIDSWMHHSYSYSLEEISKDNDNKHFPMTFFSDCETIISIQLGSYIVWVNDKQKTLDAPPVLKEGRIFVNARFLHEVYHLDFDWLPSEERVTITNNKDVIMRFWIDFHMAEVNGEMFEIDPVNPGQTKPFIFNNRSFFPLSFINETLGYKSKFYGENSHKPNTVEIGIGCP